MLCILKIKMGDKFECKQLPGQSLMSLALYLTDKLSLTLHLV